MARIAKTQNTDATWSVLQAMDNEKRRKAAEERYYATVRECNFSECPHYKHDAGRCPHVICVYDVKEDDPYCGDWDDDALDCDLEGFGFEWVE